jgi:putative inorganic carbon (hco3(-)) transporter
VTALPTELLLSQAIQLGITVLLALGLIFLRARRSWLGAALVLCVWLLAPLVRRLLGLALGPSDLDILSVTPFLLTGLAAVLELPRLRPRPLAVLVVGLAGVALAVGIPAGLSDPPRLAFAMLAYYAALSAAVLGYADSASASRPGLTYTLIILAVPLALYAMVQYWFPALVPWDQAWIAATDMGSLRAMEPGHYRAFGTLNSQVPLAVVLAVAVLVLIGSVRSSIVAVIAASLTGIALALTYVRSAWVALALAAAVLVVASRSREVLLRVGAVVLIAAALVGVGWGNPTVDAIVGRAVTLSAVTEDVSAGERAGQVRETVPRAVSTFFGHGLGQRGPALALGGARAAGTADNGYLGLLYQTGPLGFLAMGLAIGVTALLALLAVLRRVPGADVRLAILGFMVAINAFTDVLYGVVGVILWYTVGSVLATAPALDTVRRARLGRGIQAAEG